MSGLAEHVVGDVIDLSDDEAVLVIAEANAAARVLPEPARADAAAIAEQAADGLVPAGLVDSLEYVLTTSLAGGRARRLYTAEGEKALAAVLARTPGGKARREALGEVNRALAALQGRELNGVTVKTRVPGSHTLAIQTDGATITLGFSTAGVTVESVTL